MYIKCWLFYQFVYENSYRTQELNFLYDCKSSRRKKFKYIYLSSINVLPYSNIHLPLSKTSDPIILKWEEASIENIEDKGCKSLLWTVYYLINPSNIKLMRNIFSYHFLSSIVDQFFFSYTGCTQIKLCSLQVDQKEQLIFVHPVSYTECVYALFHII